MNPHTSYINPTDWSYLLYEREHPSIVDGFRDQRKNLSHKFNDILTIFERGAYVTEKTTIERKLSDQEQHLHVKATSS